MRDFKALLYCRQTLNQNAIESLSPLLNRPFPFQLDELTLIDTKMGASLIEQLCDTLINGNARLRKFTLIDVHHSERSFERLINWVETSG